MKFKPLILFAIFSTFLISCEKDMKWVNPNDSKADQAEIQKICKANNFECGIINANYQGASFEIDCGKCADGYLCDDDNMCQDIDECADPSKNNCNNEVSTCANEEGSYSCICKENYSGDDCVPDTRLKDCEGLPENAAWNQASRIEQTWNGSEWAPSNKGFFSEETSESECRFKCLKNYTWNSSQCAADTNKVECTGLPENARWNTVSEITQTWNGSEWMPSNEGTYDEKSSSTKCRFKCKEHYNWDEATSKCEVETQTANCSSKPSDSVWNDNGADGKFTQNWTDSGWSPASYVSEYSETAGVCKFKCVTDYHWENNQCIYNTKTSNCPEKPANSLWNDNGANGIYTQTWTDSGWNPASYSSTFNKTAGICVFVCDTGYIWDNSTCIVAPTQEADCSAKPANTVWNDNGKNGKFTQTYDGTVWDPASYASGYSETAGTCKYKCAADYHRENNQCVSDTKTADCPAKPANSLWNDNGANGTFTQNWTDSGWNPASYTSTYSTTAGVCRYKCATNYNWNSTNKTCDAATQPGNCSSKPANTVWNDNGAGGKFTQTWSGEAWNPASYTSSYSETAGECRYKCDSSYHRENNQCISNTKTADCPAKPANTVWNDNGADGTYTQTWNSSSGWSASYSSSHSTTAGICKYKCDSTHTWEGGSCINQKTVNCTGLPAEHASWNTATSITQTWTSANGWQPSATGVYDETASTEECHFKCDANYYWDESECVNPCDYEPCNEIANAIPNSCSASSWQDYTCECEDGYAWNGSQCVITLGNICTGQNKCYNNNEEISCPSLPDADFFGQDAQYAASGFCYPQSFTLQTISDDKVVFDNNTGLSWEISPSTDTYTWDDAHNHCDDLNSSNYGGINTWRVPNPLELLTIVDNSTYNPATNSNFMGMQTSPNFWTSKEYANHGRILNSFLGTLSSATTSTYKVLCVSGNEMPKGVFTTQTVNGKVVVTDSTTGLMWQKEYATDKTWQQALKYCEESTYASHTDWRLPNKNELASLLNHDKSDNPYSDFPDMPSNYFWSSSTLDSDTESTWITTFNDGYVGYNNTKLNSRYVRCVRNTE